LLEALAAEDGAALRWSEWHRGLFPALRAISACLDPAETTAVVAARNGSQHGHALCLAGFTTLGLVPELLVVKEQLFPSREDKIRAAVNTLYNLVLKFH
jgi:hypothetical protein